MRTTEQARATLQQIRAARNTAKTVKFRFEPKAKKVHSVAVVGTSEVQN